MLVSEMEECPDYNLFHVAFVIVSAELVRGLKDNYLLRRHCHFHSHAHSVENALENCVVLHISEELTLIMFPSLSFLFPLSFFYVLFITLTFTLIFYSCFC